MKFLVINGVNLNLTGLREQSVYGTETLAEINEKIVAFAEKDGDSVDFYQSNIEGELINKIHEVGFEYDGIILNAGAYTHYGLALMDAIKAVSAPVVEVHISNVHQREEFRHHSVISCACKGVICGFGLDSYRLALEALLHAK